MQRLFVARGLVDRAVTSTFREFLKRRNVALRNGANPQNLFTTWPGWSILTTVWPANRSPLSKKTSGKRTKWRGCRRFSV